MGAASRYAATLFLLFIVGLTGCAPGDQIVWTGTQQPPAPVDDVSAQVVEQQRIAEMEALEAQHLAAELRYIRSLQHFTEKQLRQEVAWLEEMRATRGDPEYQLRLAWALSMRDTGVHDLPRASALVEGLMPFEDGERTAVGDLATILHEKIKVEEAGRQARERLLRDLQDERRERMHSEQAALTQTAELDARAARIQSLRAEIDALTAQIDALTSIEKTISERESTQ
jgi:hypothetical protein